MPRVVVTIKNQPANAAFWFGKFLKRNTDGSLTQLAENEKTPNPATDYQPITAKLVFSQFLETTGFWRFSLLDSAFGGILPFVLPFPSNESPIVATDGNYVLDWAAKTLTRTGMPIVWLLVGGGVVAGLVFLASRGRGR
jgi:hypothetical protein